MKEYWDELFKNREKNFPHEAILEKYIEIFEGKKVVELGAGDGRNCCYLASRDIDMTAFEYSESAIEKIRSKAPNIKTKVIDIETEEFDYKEYQVVLLIHYFPSFKRFKEIIATLAKDSMIFIYTFIEEEVDGKRKTVGIGYEEIAQMNSLGIIIQKEFLKDERGKSVFIHIKK